VERGLLVDDRRPQRHAIDHTEPGIDRRDPGQTMDGDAMQAAHLGAPCLPREIQQAGPRRSCQVGHERAAQTIQEERVGGPQA